MEKNTSKILMHVRKFISRVSNSMNLASITAKIQLGTWRNERPMRDSDYEYVNADLILTSGNATLQFNIGFDEVTYKEDLKSLNVLHKTIVDFRKNVIVAKKIYDSIQERKELDSKRSLVLNEDYQGWEEEDYVD